MVRKHCPLPFISLYILDKGRLAMYNPARCWGTLTGGSRVEQEVESRRRGLSGLGGRGRGLNLGFGRPTNRRARARAGRGRGLDWLGHPGLHVGAGPLQHTDSGLVHVRAVRLGHREGRFGLGVGFPELVEQVGDVAIRHGERELD